MRGHGGFASFRGVLTGVQPKPRKRPRKSFALSSSQYSKRPAVLFGAVSSISATISEAESARFHAFTPKTEMSALSAAPSPCHDPMAFMFTVFPLGEMDTGEMFWTPFTYAFTLLPDRRRARWYHFPNVRADPVPVELLDPLSE